MLVLVVNASLYNSTAAATLYFLGVARHRVELFQVEVSSSFLESATPFLALFHFIEVERKVAGFLTHDDIYLVERAVGAAMAYGFDRFVDLAEDLTPL